MKVTDQSHCESQRRPELDHAGAEAAEAAEVAAKPVSGRIAVKVINHLGDEVMKVFSIVRGM